LTVAQTIPDAKAIIVTTPQDVALSDVRKSINFCHTIHMDIIGLVENMGPFECPCCGKPIALFKSGGGQATAARMAVSFLGTLPFDPQVVKACDDGMGVQLATTAPAFMSAVGMITDKVLRSTEP
jgi:Mrp family chromosome partitioning ATPase